MPTDNLPPTEYLVMEVLTARWRLGEKYWTFPQNFRHILNNLQNKQLLWWKSGTAEKTCVAGLSIKGQQRWLIEDYTPPPLALEIAFQGARILFWDCPEDHPRLPQRVRIKWEGDLATCLDCGRTNKDNL